MDRGFDEALLATASAIWRLRSVKAAFDVDGDEVRRPSPSSGIIWKRGARFSDISASSARSVP